MVDYTNEGPVNSKAFTRDDIILVWWMYKENIFIIFYATKLGCWLSYNNGPVTPYFSRDYLIE